MTELEKPVRPYWHVDAKWIFGILFSFLLFISTLLYILSKLTSPEVLIPTASYIVASQFSKNGLDDPTDIEITKQKFLATGQDKYYPFGKEQNAYLTVAELNSLSPRQIRLRIFSQIVEPIYYKKTSQDSLKEYGFLAVLNIDTHNTLNRIFVFTLIPLLVSLAGLIAFSWKYGKFISPAVNLLLMGLPATILFWLITHSTPPEGDTGPLSFLPRDILIQVINSISGIFNIYVFIGVALILGAIITKLVLKFLKPKNSF